MNDQQNTVVATTVCGLILVIAFLCPWRIESTGELKWSPIYQQPMFYVRSYDPNLGTKGGYSIEPKTGHIAYGIMALEVVALLLAKRARYTGFLRDPEEKDEPPPSSQA
ncbi:MAG: hypothetical protein U5J63_00045 [Fodinibius sp.]|nr:hypothetical protein [Fodinibius sp.]